MNRLTPILLLSLVVAGCASQAQPKLAVCDGKYRRPANPYGSVLPDAPLDGAAAVKGPAASAPTPPAEAAKPDPGPVAALDPQSTKPCGRGL